MTFTYHNINLKTTDLEFVRPKPDIDLWEREATQRFESLCKSRIAPEDPNPFRYGYWHASFVLTKPIQEMNLLTFLAKLRASVTNRTGWNIGWVPTRREIVPYPYKNGIEVWLAESGVDDPGHSDFWRAEPVGRFSLFRGHGEDGRDYPLKIPPGKVLDFHVVLWRISEFLLYVESFAEKMGVADSEAIVKVTWTGLENRLLTYYEHPHILGPLDENDVCRQETISSTYEIEDCQHIRKRLIRDVHSITEPLFEVFNFFQISEADIKSHIKNLFDPDKELTG